MFVCISRAIHREGSRSLQLLLKPDMTYFKDHLGKTLMHVAAEKGSMAACEVVLKLRPDAIHDRDKKVRENHYYQLLHSLIQLAGELPKYIARCKHKKLTEYFYKTYLVPMGF